MGDMLTVTCTSDESYIPHLIPLINSINTNTSNIRLYIRLVNVEQEVGVTLYDLHPNIEILWDNTSLSTKRELLNGDGVLISFIDEGRAKYGYLLSEKICYCSNIKYNTINRLLSRGDPYILHMDVDAIVRKGLYELVQLIKQHDIVIRKDTGLPKFRRNSEPNGETYRQGVIGINNTAPVRRLFDRIETAVSKDMKNWDADQISFYHVFEAMKDELKFYNLPISYRDACYASLDGDTTSTSFNDNSHIWSGSHRSKYIQEIYMRERDKYNI